MNEGLIVDCIDFGVNNKIIFVYSDNSIMEKFFIYPPKNNLSFIKNFNRLDYFMLINYETLKKKNNFDFEIINDFSQIKYDLKKVLTAAIFCDFLKNSFYESSISNIKYEKIILFINVFIQKNCLSPFFCFSFLILFIYYLIYESGAFNNSNYNIETNKKIYDEVIEITKFFPYNFEEILKYLDNLMKMDLNKLKSVLHFFINLFKFTYHRKSIKSETFINLII